MLSNESSGSYNLALKASIGSKDTVTSESIDLFQVIVVKAAEVPKNETVVEIPKEIPKEEVVEPEIVEPIEEPEKEEEKEVIETKAFSPTFIQMPG